MFRSLHMDIYHSDPKKPDPTVQEEPAGTTATDANGRSEQVQQTNQPQLPFIPPEHAAEPEDLRAKSAGAFGGVNPIITEEEIKGPAGGIIIKWLVNEYKRLLDENATLKKFETDYYTTHERMSVLDSKLNSESKFQILYSICLTVGGLIFGAAFSVSPEMRTTLIVSGLVLVVVGAVLSFVVKKT